MQMLVAPPPPIRGKPSFKKTSRRSRTTITTSQKASLPQPPLSPFLKHPSQFNSRRHASSSAVRDTIHRPPPPPSLLLRGWASHPCHQSPCPELWPYPGARAEPPIRPERHIQSPPLRPGRRVRRCTEPVRAPRRGNLDRYALRWQDWRRHWADPRRRVGQCH